MGQPSRPLVRARPTRRASSRAPTPRRRRTAPLDILDELIFTLNGVHCPTNMHGEVRLTGRLDADRLRDAVRHAAQAHPIARARVAPARPTDRRYRWEIADALESVPLEVVECEDDEALVGARERLLRTAPPLETPGPFEIVLAHHPAGDAIVLSIHHAAGDGAAQNRFITSILRAYAGEDDPLPDVDPLAARNLRALTGRSLRARARRLRGAADILRRLARPPTHIAPSTATPGDGNGVEMITFSPDEVDAVRARRPDGTGLNDVLLGGLAVAIRRWNEDHGAPARDVYLMMPVNFRPAEWRKEVFGNFAPWAPVRLSGAEHRTLATAARVAAARARHVKDNDIGALMVDQIELPYELPVGIARYAPRLNPRRLAVDTAMLTNIGRIDELPAEVGAAGRVTAVWASPPIDPQMGAALCVSAFDRHVFIGFRYHHAVLDRAGACAFAQLYKRTLLAD